MGCRSRRSLKRRASIAGYWTPCLAKLILFLPKGAIGICPCWWAWWQWFIILAKSVMMRIWFIRKALFGEKACRSCAGEASGQFCKQGWDSPEKIDVLIAFVWGCKGFHLSLIGQCRRSAYDHIDYIIESQAWGGLPGSRLVIQSPQCKENQGVKALLERSSRWLPFLYII